MEEGIFNTTRAFVQTRKHYGSSYIIRLGLYTLTCVIVLSSHYLRPSATLYLRQHLNDVAAYSIQRIHQPLQSLQNFIRSIHSVITQYQQASSSITSSASDEDWQWQLRTLHNENQKLKKSLRYVQRDHQNVTTARAFLDFNNRHLQTITIDAGAQQGLAVDQPVVAYGRLVGRIIEVSLQSAVALLITDSHSRIPIDAEWSGARGILTGDNTTKLTFLHERERTNLLEGELVFTTGDGGIYPPGYVIGKICVDDDEHVYVDPRIDWQRLDYVQILDVTNSHQTSTHLNPPTYSESPLK